MGHDDGQDENLAQLKKVSKEKPSIKKTLPGPETFFECIWLHAKNNNNNEYTQKITNL